MISENDLSKMQDKLSDKYFKGYDSGKPFYTHITDITTDKNYFVLHCNVVFEGKERIGDENYINSSPIALTALSAYIGKEITKEEYEEAKTV